MCSTVFVFFFFFNDTATTEIYTLSLHDALPICFGTCRAGGGFGSGGLAGLLLEPFLAGAGLGYAAGILAGSGLDRKSTRLNSSHANISYAVFCLKKKKKRNTSIHIQTYKDK